MAERAWARVNHTTIRRGDYTIKRGAASLTENWQRGAFRFIARWRGREIGSRPYLNDAKRLCAEHEKELEGAA